LPPLLIDETASIIAENNSARFLILARPIPFFMLRKSYSKPSPMICI
jgi:hypothetical protein